MESARKSVISPACFLMAFAKERATSMTHSMDWLDNEVRAGCIDAGSVQQIVDQEGIDPETLMLRLLSVAARLADAPVSKYAVGAVARATSTGKDTGGIYLGANLEFVDDVLGMTVHAEQAAVNNAWLNGESGIQTILVSATPCGHCRQFLNEITTADELDVLIAAQAVIDNVQRYSLRDLLPRAFGPETLGQAQRLMMPSPTPTGRSPTADELTQRASISATESYAPYTGNLAGIALRTSTGRMVCGRAAENAAFNPSLTPLASALSQLSLTGCRFSGETIVDAVLVERPTLTSQRPATERLLHHVAPDVTIRYVTLQ